MKRKLVFLFAVLPLITACIASGQKGAHSERYIIVDVGTLGGTFSAAHGLNDRGWAAGIGTLPGDASVRAFERRNGRLIDLGTLGGPNSDVGFTPFENDGVIAGDAEVPEADPTGADFCLHGTQLICLPVVWHHDRIEVLPTLGGNNGVANQINSHGQVAGVAENEKLGPACFAPGNVLQFKPVLYDQASIQELSTFAGDLDGVALAINEKGQVGGFSFSCTDAHALLWEGGHVRDLGNLGGSPFSNASAINNLGELAGVSNLPGDMTAHAFLWRAGIMEDLGTISGEASFASVAIGINDKSQVVGQSCNAEDDFCRAFIWHRGMMLDLNNLIPHKAPWFLFEADTINTAGEIVGVGVRLDLGEVHGFLAIPCQIVQAELPSCVDAPSDRSAEDRSQLSFQRVSVAANSRSEIYRRAVRRFRFVQPGATH